MSLDEDALRRLLDEIPVGIGIAEPVEPDGSIKPDARIVYYNKHWVKMFGFDVDDVRTVGNATRRLYPNPELLEERLRSRQEAASRRRAGGGEQTEARAMGANGQWIDVITGTSVLGDRLVVTMLDISEGKKAEDNLRRTLMNLPIPVACGTNDEAPRISLVNHAFTGTFGYESEDVPTVERWLELAYPDPAYRAQVLARWLEGMEKGRNREGTVDSHTVQVHCKDGTVRNVIFSATLLPSGPVVTFQDITEIEKAAQQAADDHAKAEAEATMRERITLAARAAKSAFWEWDLVTGAVTWSQEMMDFFAVPESERHTNRDPWKLWRDRVHPEDWAAAADHAAKAHDTQSPIGQEYRIVMPDGEIRWIESRGDVIRDDAGRAVRIAGINIDITARKKAEQEAADYRTQLEQLLAERTTELDTARRQLELLAYEVTENIPAGTYTMVQPPGGGFARFSFLSSRFLELCGLTREAAAQDPLNVYAMVHPEEHDEFLRKNIETFERKLPFNEEFRAVIRGETRWFHAASNPRLLPDGSTVWEGVLTDITGRKEAELARAKSERSMKLAASAARLGFWEIDVSTRLDRWDEEMARIHGIHHEDFDGHWEKFVHPDDYEAVMRETRRMLETDTNFEMDYRIVRPSGEVRYIREHGNVIRDKEGRPLSASGVMQDITEHKLAEEKIREAAQRMQLAASAAGLGFWSRDNATGLEEWDDEMLRIYGVGREEFDGRWEPFVHPEDIGKVQRLTQDALAAGTIGKYEYRIIRPDGTVRHIRGMSTSVRGLRGQFLQEIGVNFDITAEKQAAERERQLARQHRRDLEQKLKTSLTAAAVAHEINQPLSAILLDSQMALERIKGDSRELEQARAFLSSTISNAERTVDTIGKMMSLLRSVQTKPQQVDLVNVVRSAELYAKDALRAAGTALHIEGAGRAMTIRGDEGQLLLAVSNLVRNAIEAIRSVHTGRLPEILVSLSRQGKSVVLSVADSGPGLPRETLAKIPLNTTKPQGTGLGLFIVQSVADNHGAKLEARQTKLGGAELRLVFPAGK